MKIDIKNSLFRAKFIAILLFAFVACNENILEETPLSFISPDNLYVDQAGFEAAVVPLYSRARSLVTEPHIHWVTGIFFGAYGADMGYSWDYVNGPMSDYSRLNGSNHDATLWFYGSFWAIVRDANTILSRIEDPEIKWIEDDAKNRITAEARFFRAFAYRFLAHLYGGVPILREEITAPRTEFIRDSREDVYEFIVEDLEFATQYLPQSETKDGQIVKAAADNYLAEIYICLQQYDKAIQAASRVIDDPQYELMTERFGSLKDKPANVFWDLFRIGNQNRSAGNTEAIWVVQLEYEKQGGGTMRNGPRQWNALYWDITDPDGNKGTTYDMRFGRPVSWHRMTYHSHTGIWLSDWDNDMRNDSVNMFRDYVYNNPESAYYGQKITTLKDPAKDSVRVFPQIMKVSHPYGNPQEWDMYYYYFGDFYMLRLPETILLRAEAYLAKGDKQKAADDINKIRIRANATPVTSDKVNIDYILDERMRELYTEEWRALTLMRMGLLDDRTKKYNSVSGPTIQEYHNLWPFPESEIDRSGGTLVQNPGYEK